MDVPIDHAGSELDELVLRAQAGEDIVLTRSGRPIVRLAPIPSGPVQLSGEEKRRRLDELLSRVDPHRPVGPSAARSQDFLYDEDGLPT